MHRFAGGSGQAAYMTRVGSLAPQKCLVVPVDVGKRTAMMVVADHHGRVVGGPVEFGLTKAGLAEFVAAVTAARVQCAAESVRIGIEAAGHYHWSLASTLRSNGFDVVELNPYQVKLTRAQLGQARLKTDLRDCLAMAELLVRGQGWPLHRLDGAVAEQAALVAHRRRKAVAIKVLGGQIHALADVAFPGLTGCFTTGLEAKALRIRLATTPDPARVASMLASQLVAHAAAHDVRMLRPKAEQVIAAARDAMCIAESTRAVAADLLAGEMATFDALNHELTRCGKRLGELLPLTPAGVLTSIPGVGVVTASSYAAALGDAHRFANADAAYRFSGLAPTSYESAGRRATTVHISKIGSAELRQAIISLGICLTLHLPDFAEYKARQRAAGKKPIVATIAAAHRAHRLAFAILRSQQPFDPTTWAASTNRTSKRGRPVTAAEATQTT